MLFDNKLKHEYYSCSLCDKRATKLFNQLKIMMAKKSQYCFHFLGVMA